MTTYYSAYEKKKPGGAIFFLFALGVLLTLGLYFVKTRAQTAKAEAASLERTLKAEVAEISKLKSELALLENPNRLEFLAVDAFGMTSTSVDRVLTFNEIEEKIPLKETGGKPGGGAGFAKEGSP